MCNTQELDIIKDVEEENSFDGRISHSIETTLTKFYSDIAGKFQWSLFHPLSAVFQTRSQLFYIFSELLVEFSFLTSFKSNAIIGVVHGNSACICECFNHVYNTAALQANVFFSKPDIQIEYIQDTMAVQVQCAIFQYQEDDIQPYTDTDSQYLSHVLESMRHCIVDGGSCIVELRNIFSCENVKLCFEMAKHFEKAFLYRPCVVHPLSSQRYLVLHNYHSPIQLNYFKFEHSIEESNIVIGKKQVDTLMHISHFLSTGNKVEKSISLTKNACHQSSLWCEKYGIIE